MLRSCTECGAFRRISKEESNLAIPTTTLVQCHRLMKSNGPPNEQESSYIQAVVSHTGARLACLNHDILQLRDLLKDLEEERAELSDYHAQHSAVLSPLRRMPPELLAEIFLWTLSSDYAEMGDAGAVKRSPWILAQVCSRWRTIALSTPSLWSLLYFDYDKDLACPLAMVQTQIERAQLLKINFYGSEETHRVPQIEMFQYLSQYSARWDELNIRLTSFVVPGLTALQGRLPSLRRLRMEWIGEEAVDSIDCFERASSLVEVAIRHDSSLVNIPLPAHQLTSYHLEGPWSMHQNALKAAPNLVEAKIIIRLHDSEEWPDPTDDFIDMQHLQRLYVSDLQVVRYLRAPALSETVIPVGSQEELNHFDAFIARSSCSLQRLGLQKMIDPDLTFDILKKYPYITGLALIFGAWSDSLVDQLATFYLKMLTHGNDAVSPQLAQLTQIYLGTVSDWSSLHYTLFLKMLESRRKSGCSLSSAALVSFDPSPDPDPATLYGLDALRTSGLDLLVGSGAKVAMKHVNAWMFGTPWN